LPRDDYFYDETQPLRVLLFTDFSHIFGTAPRAEEYYTDKDDGSRIYKPSHSHMEAIMDNIIALEADRMKAKSLLKDVNTQHKYRWRYHVKKVTSPRGPGGSNPQKGLRWPLCKSQVVILDKAAEKAAQATAAGVDDEDDETASSARKRATFYFSDAVDDASERAFNKRKGDYIPTDVDLTLLKQAISNEGFNLDKGVLRVRREPRVQGQSKYYALDGGPGDEDQLQSIMAQFLEMAKSMHDPDYIISYVTYEELEEEESDDSDEDSSNESDTDGSGD